MATKGFSIEKIGIIVGIYPIVWGIGQLFTGKMADKYHKKKMLYIGMLLQAIALLFFAFANTMIAFIGLSIILGWGTAMVYPTFLATIADNTHPDNRAQSIGVFRFWRDLGYAVGAIITGVIADAFNLETPILFISGLTLISSVIIYYRMSDKQN